MSEAESQPQQVGVIGPADPLNQPAPFPLPFQRSIYNSKSVKSMPPNERDAITACGVPLDFYMKGVLDLGAANSSALKKMANTFTAIYKNNLPIPPSPIVEWIADRTMGDSKQDFSWILDGKKGSGKSRTSLYFGGRYGLEAAARMGGKPEDYFCLENCALLEDTEAISRIMMNAKRYQFIIIDDASVALGSRDFAQQKNKNFNKLLTTCRTRRWVVLLNVPMASHLDLQIRELVDAKASIYRSYHAGGFNVLKIHSSDVQFRLNKKYTYEKRLSFFNKKIDFFGAFSIGTLGGCYKDYEERYDKQRDDATTRILTETAESEQEMADPRGKREKKWDALREEYFPILRECMGKDEFINKKNGQPIIRRLEQETGLNQPQIYRLLAELKEADSGKKRGR